MVEEFVDVAAAGAWFVSVGVGGRLEKGEEDDWSVDIERVVGVGVLVDEREDVSCAKEEVGRIHERNRRVEEYGIVDREQRQIFLERRDSIFRNLELSGQAAQ